MICANKERRLSCAHTAVPFHLKNCKWMQPPHLVPAGGVPVPPISALLTVGTRQRAWSANGGGWCLINTLPLPYAFPCIRTVYRQSLAGWPLVKVTVSGCLAEKKQVPSWVKTCAGLLPGSQFWLILEALHLFCNFKRCIFIHFDTESQWGVFHEYIKHSGKLHSHSDYIQIIQQISWIFSV